MRRDARSHCKRLAVRFARPDVRQASQSRPHQGTEWDRSVDLLPALLWCCPTKSKIHAKLRPV
jgi:hypothetical protein